jgi:ubiquitin C-terminal hydrolase
LISLPIPLSQEETTLEQCLMNNFNVDEHLNENNQYHCDKCSQKSDAVKNTTLWHAPHRLIIQFKRFVSVGQMTYKNKKNIKFPLTGLNLKPFISPYVDGEYMYDLYGVIHHSGDLQGGHYIAYTKNAITDKWYLFDDDNVLHIDEDKIEDKINNSGAYVLIYKKRDILPLTENFSDDEFDISDVE